ncbi:MAG: serine/threonine-protein kinase [Myxococcota bacterium]
MQVIDRNSGSEAASEPSYRKRRCCHGRGLTGGAVAVLWRVEFGGTVAAVVGDRIGEWVVDAQLGSGGMGSVYRCHNVASDRILAAIKVLERQSVHEDSSARFLREAEILFSLEHPNIVKVRSVSMEAELPFLEMEFVEGDSLEDHIRTAPMPTDQAIELIMQALDALVYMHARGVCHRDLKPANLLVTPEGELKVVDFGLAVQPEYGRLTTEGFTFGTVSYAPPEWGQPDGLDPVQWDLYAIGVVFYELLRGAYAFPLSGEGTIKQQLMQVMMVKQHAPALDVGEEFPERVRTLIAALTDPDPNVRPKSASEARTWLRKGLPARVMARHGPIWWRPAVVVTFATIGAATAMAAVSATVPFLASRPPPRLVVDGSPPMFMEPPPVSPTPRTIEVRVEDFHEELPFAVASPGRAVVAADASGTLLLENIERIATELTWVAGNDCEPCWDEAATCPLWCARGVEVVGPEETTVVVELGVMPRRVLVDVPSLVTEVGRSVFRPRKTKARYRLRGWLGGEAGEVTDHHTLTFNDVWPGEHRLTVDVGQCKAHMRGCWPNECPAGCASWREPLVVPWVTLTADGELPDISTSVDVGVPR